MQSLFPTFDMISITKTKDANILFVNELIDSLLVHEQKMNRSLHETSWYIYF